ncbi:MAG: hypothetical protein HY043_11860 [Verrucomicrobia bacterium]|nr:hypothetical protein [Verrucomicrobiota bacterium]
MKCPSCNSTDIQFRGMGYAWYPTGAFGVIALPFAKLIQISSPRYYHCNACGADSAHRTGSGKIAFAILAILALTVLGIFTALVYHGTYLLHHHLTR